MAGDVNAAIEGALLAGAEEIVVNDAHGTMRNLCIEDIHPAARLISGYPKPQMMMCGLDASFDGAMFILSLIHICIVRRCCSLIWRSAEQVRPRPGSCL